MFEEKTDEVILDDMLNNARDDVDKREGSVVYDLLAPAAIELSLAYIELDAVLALGFADTSEGEWLERKVGELGVTRKPAVKATGEVTFTGDASTLVPQGTRLFTNEGVYFVTLEDKEVEESGEVNVPIEAEEGGAAGNVGTGAIEAIEGDLADILSVTNKAPIEGGIDAEDDESLLERYLDRVRKPTTSGNKYHYEQWAKEIAGIGDVKVYPLHGGPGTVKVVLLDVDKTAPSQALIEEVAEHIENSRPVGASVAVVGADEIPININVNIIGDENIRVEAVIGEIKRRITEYLASIAFKDTPVRYTRIAAELIEIPEVIDFENLTVNGATSNITVEDGQVAVVGEVTVNVN